MKERPILFSSPMVRAILDGRKTQTRRVVKPQPKGKPELGGFGRLWFDGQDDMRCPYGQPGVRLWVRETWADANSEGGPCVLYRADDDRRYLVDEGSPVDYAKYPGANFAQWAADVESGAEGRYRPSIHMPRWACRLVLEITGVRVERLRDISEADAIAEGTTPSFVGRDLEYLQYRAGFESLWSSINGADSWAPNPWVWVVTFKRVTP